ncbi:hypothetical protein EW145_g7431 [Phellinidium pouzarii]|uniref:Methionine aminopeptidase n=1 Tax=Phellinidium pouzarii TaxID=167371 RepID=A0A4S4KJM9_9AGAM|nr:hypothetical protein EW145_g7431 [Phellinidium pouzarii]
MVATQLIIVGGESLAQTIMNSTDPIIVLCQSSSCIDGNPPSRLECPACSKMGIKGSFFCSQECFKKDSHGFSKSESLEGGRPPRILNSEEQEKMRTLAREVLDIAAAAIKPGITTDEIDEIVHEETIKRNAYPSPLNYLCFPKSVCTSINEAICHGIPDRRKLLDGDIVNIGYHGDLNETYAVGDINDDSKKLIRTTRECLDEAIKICKPGALFRDIGKVIEPIAKRNGFSIVRNYTGHGINDLFHCNPRNIPHYAANKAVGTMKAGMTFTIEPMLNIGTWDGIHWPDDWTYTTADGKRSAQFEETLLITETGVEVLTAGAKRDI